jgi:large subunit ribosomal protein L23
MNRKKVLRKPIFTEKSFREATNGKYTFEVDTEATKKEVARVVEEIFEVDVLEVKTQIVKGRRARIRGTKLTRPGKIIKKAVVRLASGQKIPVFETG